MGMLRDIASHWSIYFVTQHKNGMAGMERSTSGLGSYDKKSLRRSLSGKIARKSAATDEAVAAAMSAILSYVKSERTDDLTLTTKFSSEDRKVLHSFCSEYGLFHRSLGPEGDRVVRL